MAAHVVAGGMAVRDSDDRMNISLIEVVLDKMKLVRFHRQRLSTRHLAITVGAVAIGYLFSFENTAWGGRASSRAEMVVISGSPGVSPSRIFIRGTDGENFMGHSSPNAAVQVRLDPVRLRGIIDQMKQFVERGTVAGVVTLVANHERVLQLEAAGFQDLESREPMHPNTLFRAMSMTKPVTAVAIMMLVEEGRLTLDDPIGKHLSEFRNMRVITQRQDELLCLRKPSRPITIRDLLTHTSGMPGTDPPALQESVEKARHSLAENVLLFSQQALEFDPGERWLYSGPGYATLGRVVEQVSHIAFERFLEERVFKTLEMKDTFFFPPARVNDRVAVVYRFKGGKLVRSNEDFPRDGVRYANPAGGLFSTASDMAIFLQMMSNGGVWRGRRVLSEASIALMTRSHTGGLRIGNSSGEAFGLGWELALEKHPGRPWKGYGHAGALGTFEWVDPVRDLLAVFMIQRLGEGGSLEQDTFLRMVDSSVLE